MKTERENYLKLTGDMASLGGRLIGLRGELGALKAETQPLEHEALKAEIRGDGDYLSKRKALEAAQGRILAIEGEIAAGEKKAKAMTEILVELREKAAVELTFEWRGIFGQALKSFVRKAQEAAQAELDLEEIRKKAITAFGEIGSPCLIGDWPAILMRDRSHPSNPSEFERFVQVMRLAGYKIEDLR